MLRLVENDVVRARHGHHDHESIAVILNCGAELRALALQFRDRGGDIVAHQRDQMVPRRFVSLARVDAAGRVYAHFARPGLEDQPALASALHILDAGPAEDVAQEGARRGRVVGIDQGVDAGDHRTERTVRRVPGL